MRPVPGNLIQLALAEHGGVDVLVASLPLDLPDVLLERVPDRGAGGQPVRQPGADHRVGVEKLELTAELAMVVHGPLLAMGRGRVTRGHAKAPERSPRGLPIRAAVSAPGATPASSS